MGAPHCARCVEDVVPGSAVVMGSSIGRYPAKVTAWDFEVSDDDLVVTLELLGVRPSEVAKLLERARTLSRLARRANCQ